ncbi:CRISPR-associated endoribonuclease Cas6 [Spirosoma utsteinense]|uniref:CRISPR-associated endoribonuclease Cas6 n=1 Tax=Spirosoma utsteinense TaxID=2585773 RepID=A0ABR6W8M4_9BACT|nr:CRISPR-associated endoribonuclease Cas6 [Spirosoma utsteinense]MBC3787236.1 CRISPR-associated endoribonuclease Cas6 [Spirosoma utsteinense]MBC3792922.1 CRISPR-associated endoribonuclease Cas6 [Spirosoma utsteinense]
MQFRLTLRPVASQTLVPFNYAYRLSAFIYAVLADADKQYADFLHGKGYEFSSTRRFKLFTFSDLIMPNARLDMKAGGLWINSPHIEWVVSFYVDTAAQHFIMGLFQDQRCVIASPKHRANPGRANPGRAEFIIERVEAVPVEIRSQTVQLRTLSPVVIAEKDARGMDQYLHPSDEQFGPLLVSNVLAKYSSIQTAVPAGEAPADSIDAGSLTYRLLANAGRQAAQPKSRLVTIKEGSREETKVRGYYGFMFELSGPSELLELAVLAGVGRYNAEGFGCVGVK